MQTFRRLSVWRKAHDLTVRVYTEADALHGARPFLAQQLVRAAFGIPTKIAAATAAPSGAQCAQHLQAAIAAARELDYVLNLAMDLGAIASRDHAMLEARADEVTRMLVGLCKTTLARDVKATRTPRSPRS